jgi:NitT/TauT family transport system permease protein
MNSRLEKLTLQGISTSVLIALWYLLRFLLGPDRYFLLPAPHDVAKAFVTKGPALFHAAGITASGALLGFITAIVVSSILALFLALSPRIRVGLYPQLMALQMTPVVVLAPLLILWAGPGLGSVTIITFLICFFPMVVNTTQGLISTDANLVDFFQMCNADRRQEIFLLRVPAALPYFFTGLRIAATLAPIGAIVGEQTAGSAAGGKGGLGYLAVVYSAQFQMGAVFAVVLVSCVLGFVLASGATGLSWLTLHKWHESYGRPDV